MTAEETYPPRFGDRPCRDGDNAKIALAFIMVILSSLVAYLIVTHA